MMLTERELAGVARLEREVVLVDGGRLKLEWQTLRDGRAECLFRWADDRLVGFVGLYRFGDPVELVGMVAPDARRAGVGGALLASALDVCRARHAEPVLLVVPRPSEGGRALGLARGVLDHSEHALELVGSPEPGPHDPLLTLRDAVPGDLLEVGRLLETGFGFPHDDLAERLNRPGERTVLVERDGAAVGTVRLTLHEGVGGVYGFTVLPGLRGQGIGRDVLRRVCLDLRSRGAHRVGLEVATDNDHALGLYLSVGFRPVVTEDYYRLAT